MFRTIFEDLKKWKDNLNKKPLIIQGARQVGKTWIMKEFGKNEYQDVLYINFERDKSVSDIFNGDLNPKNIIENLGIKYNKTIKQNTLIIFDEIQECQNALTSLKYFCEETKYNIICAGSFLGIALHQNTSFPVGKVEFLNLYPLNFNEFLIANSEEKLVNVIKKQDFERIKIFKTELEKYLKLYFYIGGMPEVVQEYINTKDLKSVRKIQERIVESYVNDFSKHADKNLFPKMLALWQSIPSQLSKENKKFVYKNIKQGARSKDYEIAMQWLSDCGLIYKINKINKPNFPINSYIDNADFKLFMVDIGLLSSLSCLNSEIIVNGSDIFTEFKGSLTEQFVLQELKANTNLPINYWTNSNGTAEVDFIIQKNKNIIPIEVKATINLQAKSLKVYNELFKPNIMIRTSLSDYKKIDNLYDVPLYIISSFIEYDLLSLNL